jgi:hypothetical protein
VIAPTAISNPGEGPTGILRPSRSHTKSPGKRDLPAAPSTATHTQTTETHGRTLRPDGHTKPNVGSPWMSRKLDHDNRPKEGSPWMVRKLRS